MLMRALLVGLGMLGLAACGETFVAAKLETPTLKLSALQPVVTRDAVGVGAQMLGFDDMQRGKTPMMPVKWKEIDTAGAMAAEQHCLKSADSDACPGGPDEGPTVQKGAHMPVIPVPAMVLVIDNHSALPIDFANATIVLESTDGKKLAALMEPSEVADRIQAYLEEHFEKASTSDELVEGLRKRVEAMPLVHKKLQIPPNQRFDGLLVFALKGFDLKEAAAAFAAPQYTLKVTGLGGDKTPFDITVKFERGVVTINVRCPQGKPPSAQLCKLPRL